jgi:CRP/FNR family transcriptional regulator, anaerobic regulatory protein
MNTEKLFSLLASIHPISPGFRSAIERVLTPLSLPQYHLLLEATKISECAYFLDDGFAMSYTFVKGKQQVDSFWKSGQIMLSARSFFEQVPSQEFIQLRTPSELFCVTHASMLDLFQRFPEANFIYRVIMNQYYEHSRERTRDLQHLTAMERYEKLIRYFPDVEQHVTQKHIASYLGIAPQSFSRIKRDDTRR